MNREGSYWKFYEQEDVLRCELKIEFMYPSNRVIPSFRVYVDKEAGRMVVNQSDNNPTFPVAAWLELTTMVQQYLDSGTIAIQADAKVMAGRMVDEAECVGESTTAFWERHKGGNVPHR